MSEIKSKWMRLKVIWVTNVLQGRSLGSTLDENLYLVRKSFPFFDILFSGMPTMIHVLASISIFRVQTSGII